MKERLKPYLHALPDIFGYQVVTKLMLIFSMFQDYADGVEILALCLLSRCWSHRKFKQ